MSNRDIKTTLAELHGELENAPSLDADLRRLLEEVDRDIHSLLEADEPRSDEAQSLRDRVDAMAADFRAQHPATASFFRELVDALGRMGI